MKEKRNLTAQLADLGLSLNKMLIGNSAREYTVALISDVCDYLQAKDNRIAELESEVKQLQHGLLIANESLAEMESRTK